MNDIMLAGLVVVGTVIALGAGGWIVNVLTHRAAKKNEPKA